MVDIKFSMFFDREGVKKHVRDGTKSVLSKAGAFARRTMKGLIRKGKKPAKPNTPPKSHTGRLKDLIYFGYDASTDSVVIGPALFGKRQDPPVPQLLNEGGETTDQSGKPLHYNKFPFVEPTFEKEKQNFPGLFSNCIK